MSLSFALTGSEIGFSIIFVVAEFAATDRLPSRFLICSQILEDVQLREVDPFLHQTAVVSDLAIDKAEAVTP